MLARAPAGPGPRNIEASAETFAILSAPPKPQTQKAKRSGKAAGPKLLREPDKYKPDDTRSARYGLAQNKISITVI